MGDLDLDLGDFQLNHPAPSPLPEVVLSVAPPVAEVHEPWPASPFSPLLPPAEAVPKAAVREEAPRVEVPSEEPAAELMFNLAPAAKPEPEAVTDAAPKANSAQAKPSSAAPPASENAAPTIKKIQFPAKRPRAAQTSTTEQRRTAPSSSVPPKSSPTTRFSASISQKAPAVSLSDRDSDPFLDGIDDSRKSGLDGSEQDDLALPEDLPAFSPLAPAVPSAKTSATWESETPTARELWHNARRAWHVTSRQAATWSGRGFYSAQKLARNVHHKLQTRLETQAEAAQAAQPLATAQTLFAEQSAKEKKAPVASFPAARRLGQTLVRKAAAPLCAVAAASVVYLAGSHFLGTDSKVSLNSSRWAGPAVPDLGSLPGSQERKPARQEGTNKPAPAQPKVPPMTSEITALPEGLSWPGKGLIEVVTSEDELIYIDGVFTGRGPLRRVPVTPGKHDVAIKTGGEERTGTVVVEAEKSTRAVFTGETVTAPAP